MAWGTAQRLIDHMAQCERDKAALNEKMDRNHNENSRRLEKIGETLDRLLTKADITTGRDAERKERQHAKLTRWMIYATIFAAIIALYADKIFRFLEPK